MSVPKAPYITLPLLRFLADGQRRKRRVWTAAVARDLQLRRADLAIPKAKGGGTLFQNRCSWAWIHLHKAGLVDGVVKREIWITPLGQALLATDPKQIDGPVLWEYESYRQWPKHWKNPLAKLDWEPTADRDELHKRSEKILKAGAPKHPKGLAKPPKVPTTTTRYKLDGAVLARVKELADGRCECCGADAPFVRPDGTKFLEQHHVRPLSEGGPDYVSNSVMLCPNCHRAIHFSRDGKRLRGQLLAKVSRLRDYPEVDEAGADAA